MFRSMIALVLLVSAGSAWGQSAAPNLGALGNIGAATSGLLVGTSRFPGGLTASGVSFLRGNITLGFLEGRNGFSAFSVIATEGTPLEPLGVAADRTYVAIYDALLPLYVALDGPAMRFAELGRPLSGPLTDAILLFRGVSFLQNSRSATASGSVGLGLPALAGL